MYECGEMKLTRAEFGRRTYIGWPSVPLMADISHCSTHSISTPLRLEEDRELIDVHIDSRRRKG